MGIRFFRDASLLVLTGVCLCTVQAQAGLLGEAFGWQYYGGGGAYNPGGGTQTNGSFTVAGGTLGTLILPGTPDPAPVFNIFADDTSITFDYSIDTLTGPWAASILSLSPTIFNGIALDLQSASTIASVTIDGATNMVGFSASNFSFTGNQIQIDWAGLAFNSSTIVKFDIALVGTPEPGTLALLFVPLLVVSRLRRPVTR